MQDENQIIESNLLQSIKNKESITRERLEQAEKINFKSSPDKVIQTDEYGFIKKPDQTSTSQSPSVSPSIKQKELLCINARIEKWNVMLSEYSTYSTSKFRKLKSRTRKGIPDSLRGYVWQQFAEVSKFFQEGLYQKLADDKNNNDPDTEIVIIRDLDRTFPQNLHFKDKYGSGQRALYHVLMAYSKFNTDTGYVQGLGFIAALLLTYMDEESSFWCIHALMKKYNLEGFYLNGFPALNRTFYVFLNLMKKFIPKVYEMFTKNMVIPSMYASEWFITLFTRELDFKVLVRIFDVLLLEGFKVIYRFALAFLKMKEEKLLETKGGIGGLMPIMKNIFNEVEVEKLFEVAFGFSLSREKIKKLEEEYEKVKEDKRNEFVALL